MSNTIYTNISEIPAYLTNHFDILTLQVLPKQGTYLFYNQQGLFLCKVGEKGQVQVNFNTGRVFYRRTKGGGELIAKAVNISSNPIVWDATGGLGRDSFILASMGLEVTVFEQNLAVYGLLCDGLQRANQCEDIVPIVQRIKLYYGNAVDLMNKMLNKLGQPDVVYLDPMYPEKQKSAAVKKEMAYFHDLVGMADIQEEQALLNVARTIAKKRVVVKRPRLGHYLCSAEPGYQYIGKSIRFDVYLPY